MSRVWREDSPLFGVPKRRDVGLPVIEARLHDGGCLVAQPEVANLAAPAKVGGVGVRRKLYRAQDEQQPSNRASHQSAETSTFGDFTSQWTITGLRPWRNARPRAASAAIRSKKHADARHRFEAMML